MLDLPLEILALVTAHKWPALGALAIAIVVRLLKEDTFLPTVSRNRRAATVWALGLVTGALELFAGGASLRDALVTAVVAPCLAFAAHESVVEALRKGRDIPLPWVLNGAGLALCLALGGCAPSNTLASAQARAATVSASAQADVVTCAKLSTRQARAKQAAIIQAASAGGLGTAASITAAVFPPVGIALGVASGLAGAGAGVAGKIAQDTAAQFVEICT